MDGGWHRGNAGCPVPPATRGRLLPSRVLLLHAPGHTDGRTEKSRDPAPVRAALRVDLRSQPSPPRGLQTWPLHRHPAPPPPALSSHTTRPACRAGGSARGASITFLQDLQGRQRHRPPACHPCRRPLGTYATPSPKTVLRGRRPRCPGGLHPPLPTVACLLRISCVPDRPVHPILTSEELGEKTAHSPRL